MSTVKLQFLNQDAATERIEFDISKDGVALVMTWYGAYCAGDSYTVFVDGLEVTKDENGELIGDLT